MSDRNIKVMLLTHAGGSPSHGPNMRWYYLGQALKQYDIDVEIISASWFHKYIIPPTVNSNLEVQDIDGLCYHWIKTAPYKRRGIRQVFNQIEFTLKCLRYARKLSRRMPDIVVASSPHPFVVYPAISIARQANARFFYEVRDLWPALLLELGNFGKLHPYILANKAAEGYAVKRAEKVLSVKPGDFDYFSKEYGLKKEHFEYIPNGFLPGTELSPAPNVIQQLRGRYSYIVGYIGAISTYYALEDLVNLADQFRKRSEVGFIVVGGGDREAMIQAMVEDKCLNNFHMIGSIGKKQVPATLKNFDICYVGLEDLDIHKYGISCNKIYDYMYAAKPILGSYVAGYDPVKAAGCGVTVKPGNPKRLADALEQLLKDKGLRIKLGKQGRSFFDKTHDFNKVAGELVKRVFTANYE